MTTEQIKSVMDELAQMGVLMLTLSGGEATLRPDFIELVAHARKRSFAVRLFTNGLTMTRELATALHRLAVHSVEISLYSHRADVHDFVTGVPRSFERTTAGIRYLAELGVDVHVKAPMMATNDGAMDALRNFAMSIGASSFAADPNVLMPREGSDRAPERLSRSQESFEAAVTGFMSAECVAPSANPRDLERRVCSAGSSLHVEPNGELRPCTMLDLDLGDALAGIVEARAHNAQRKALTDLRWKDLHGCRSCDLAGGCSHCYAFALATVGDALAPYPTACADARSKYRVRTGVAPEIVPDSAGRTELGPYRHLERNRFQASPDEITPEDDALAARLGWARRQGGALPPSGPRVRPGELVQLRRPGSKRARAMRVPALSSSSPVAVASHSGSDSILIPGIAVDS
jgi:radical SAM protein with 4Fe4S-binding SPASM domain